LLFPIHSYSNVEIEIAEEKEVKMLD